jgi:hypothetical protein
MKKLAFLVVLTLAFSMAVLAQDSTQSTGSQTTTTGSQTTTTSGDQTQQTTTTTTTTTPQTTAPSATMTTTQDTTTSTVPQKNDEGSPYRHGEIGVFANYLRLDNDLNTVGVGGNLDFNLNHHVQLEGQMAYNFERNITTATSTGGSTTFNRTAFRSLTGLFGPKFISGTGAWRVFGTLQGGFINFNNSNKGPVSGFVGSVNNVIDGNTHGVFYPGVGVEAFAGPIGVRLDVGDVMFFNDGAHNNLRIALGPQFRF